MRTPPLFIDPLSLHMIRVKVENLSALALVAGDAIWRPNRGETWMLFQAFYRRREIVGTVTDDPAFSLTNGTTAIVAAVDLDDANAYQRLTVAGNAVITNAAPLTIVISDAPAGATIWDYDLILFLGRLSD